MRRRLSVALTLVLGVGASAQQLPSEPVRQFGQSVTPSYEGWFTNADGSHSLLVGYLNRNSKAAIDVPIGPNNRIEPGGPDLGQPTHFLPGRQTGVFIIAVPREFTPQQRLTWTIVANGQAMSIPLRLNELYQVSPFTDVAVGNKPPVLRFEAGGPAMQGPIGMVAKAIARTATMAAGLALPVWATDDAKYSSGSNAPQRKPPPPVILHWSKYRGPGEVTFDKDSPAFEKLPGEEAFAGRATVTATFSQPGEYLLHVNAEDYSGTGGGGEVCCWTTAIVKVTVTP
jgi:hypothetical protein